MLEGFSVSLIVPAYNEARAISQTITNAKNFFASRNYPYEIIISVQGNDGTQAIVAEMAAQDPALKLLYNPEHHGKGLAIREAVFIAQGAVIDMRPGARTLAEGLSSGGRVFCHDFIATCAVHRLEMLPQAGCIGSHLAATTTIPQAGGRMHPRSGCRDGNLVS